jgi:hypothetical protein
MEQDKSLFELEKFAEKLIQERGVDNLRDEVVDQMKFDLTSRLEDRVNALILNTLPKELLSEFEALLDSNAKDEKVQKFCAEHIKGLDELIAGELLNFRRTYLGI